jgi:hypothetical protein
MQGRRRHSCQYGPSDLLSRRVSRAERREGIEEVFPCTLVPDHGRAAERRPRDASTCLLVAVMEELKLALNSSPILGSSAVLATDPAMRSKAFATLGSRACAFTNADTDSLRCSAIAGSISAGNTGRRFLRGAFSSIPTKVTPASAGNQLLPPSGPPGAD